MRPVIFTLLWAVGTSACVIRFSRDGGAPPPPGQTAEQRAERDERAEARYAQELEAAPKRAHGEPVNVVFCLDASQVGDEYRRVPQLAAVWFVSHERLAEVFADGIDYAHFAQWRHWKVTPVPGTRCPKGPTWWDSITGAYVEADVYVWLSLEVVPMPECPEGRGLRALARWTSAYQRKDFSFELRFCRVIEAGGRSIQDIDRAGQSVGKHVYEQIEAVVLPTLPALSEVARLPPPHRARWRKYRGGGHHHD